MQSLTSLLKQIPSDDGTLFLSDGFTLSVAPAARSNSARFPPSANQPDPYSEYVDTQPPSSPHLIALYVALFGHP